MQQDDARKNDAHGINQRGWDRRAAQGDMWSRAVSPAEVAAARRGVWQVVLTPTKPVPRDWFGDIVGKDILCLASGGGQQAPILATAGARIVVFDASAAQLAQDRAVAEREGLALETVQGFMHDLSAFPDERFDLVFHPVSNCYAPEIEPVWREAFRVLRPGGRLLAGFQNPTLYLFDQIELEGGLPSVRYPLPYSDIADRSAAELAAIVARDHTIEFSHSFDTQIGGQLRAGFRLAGLYEDGDSAPKRPIARYMPIAFATLALKPPVG